MRIPIPTVLLTGLLAAVVVWQPLAAAPMHGIAMHGALKYPADFSRFDYVDADAPQGGQLVYADVGGFDTLNPFIVRGRPAPNLRDFVFESLMTRSYDEPFSLYGLIAQSVETPEDRSWVEFTLDPRARFSDGTPVTVDDVVYTRELLRDFGRPNHRFYYAKVEKAEQTGPNRVRFSFKADEPDREMPLIMALMPVLPKHVYTRERFDRTSLEPPVGSGPYVVETIDAGDSITYRRNPEYWGRELAVNRGLYNLERLKFVFYRDSNSLFEDFKTGGNQLRIEESPDRWAQSYDFPATRDGRVVKEELPLAIPAPMKALVFNTRRERFRDRRVREALALLFDFEWINRDLFHGLYRRTRSFFDRCELSSAGRPADATERALLAPFPDAVKPAIMQHGYEPPGGDGTGRNRKARAEALQLLSEAGYVLRSGILVDGRSGEPFSFEILSGHREQERLLLSYVNMLRKAGIEARVRIVDSAQYEQRKTTYDFDMTDSEWASSLSPGNEQSFRWGSQAAKDDGSFNFAGVSSPAVDAMIEAMLQARERGEFVSAVRALDRVLLSGDYVIPLYYLPKQWVALWNPLKHPRAPSLYGLRLDTLWQSKASYEH
jgi:peptide/nickel transport system substrate-binding protein